MFGKIMIGWGIAIIITGIILRRISRYNAEKFDQDKGGKG